MITGIVIASLYSGALGITSQQFFDEEACWDYYAQQQWVQVETGRNAYDGSELKFYQNPAGVFTVSCSASYDSAWDDLKEDSQEVLTNLLDTVQELALTLARIEVTLDKLEKSDG